MRPSLPASRTVSLALGLAVLATPVAVTGAEAAVAGGTTVTTTTQSRVTAQRLAERRRPRPTSTPTTSTSTPSTPTSTTTSTTSTQPLTLNVADVVFHTSFASTATSAFAGMEVNPNTSNAGTAKRDASGNLLYDAYGNGAVTLDPTLAARAGSITDPTADYGSGQPVAGRTGSFFTTKNDKHTANGNPRAGITAPGTIKAKQYARRSNGTVSTDTTTNNEYWLAVDMYLPASSEMKTRTTGGYGQWMTPWTPAYGAPYGGPSPAGLGIEQGWNPDGSYAGNYFSMGHDSAHPAIGGKQWKVTYGKWIQLVYHFVYDYSAKDGGAGKLAIYTSVPDSDVVADRAWKQVAVKDEVTGAMVSNGMANFSMMMKGVNDQGPAYSSIGVYGDQCDTVSRVCQADYEARTTVKRANFQRKDLYSSTLRIGHSRDSVLANPTNGWVNGDVSTIR